MKIISKYKDYYDYLTGIYGIDPKIVLDRRENYKHLFVKQDDEKIILIICGYIIEGLYRKDKFYYGENLKKLSIKRKYIPYFEKENTIYIKINGYDVPFIYKPYIDKNNFNIKENCPILFESYGKKQKFPKLEDLDIQQLYSPEEMYQMINKWLSDRITEKEIDSDDIPNNQKIVNKGFDVKRSFRPKMKQR